MDDQRPPIFFLPSEMAGVWANRVHVHLTPHEFTFDFVRDDPEEFEGICVARVACSPLAVGELLDAVEPLWQQWIRNAFPQEVLDAHRERIHRPPGPQADEG